MRNYRGALVLVAGLCGAPAAASDLPTKKAGPEEIVAPTLPSNWRFEITGYGWATSLAGNGGFGPLPTEPFFANFAKIIRHFEGGFMGAATASNGAFIGGVDLIWSRLGAGVNFKNPDSALFGSHADITLKEIIATGFGGLRIPIGPPNLELYGTVGARYFNIRGENTLTTPVFGFQQKSSVTKDWVDPVAGLAAHYVINDKWFINLLTDLGGLDNSATGQALGSVGYNWTPSIATTLGYRVLYAYERDISGPNRDFRYQSWMYGPFAGFKYSF
jgi:hypothetical protein